MVVWVFQNLMNISLEWLPLYFRVELFNSCLWLGNEDQLHKSESKFNFMKKFQLARHIKFRGVLALLYRGSLCACVHVWAFYECVGVQVCVSACGCVCVCMWLWGWGGRGVRVQVGFYVSWFMNVWEPLTKKVTWQCWSLICLKKCDVTTFWSLNEQIVTFSSLMNSDKFSFSTETVLPGWDSNQQQTTNEPT